MDMRDQYGNRVGQMDAYGNPVHVTTDAYGMPIRQSVFLGATRQPHVMDPVTGQVLCPAAATGTDHHGGTTRLHRSGSTSSSSSSEDDGMGGRRRKKKSLKEKMKEKLLGGRKSDDHGHGPEHVATIGGHKTDVHGYGHGQEHAATVGYVETTTGVQPEHHHQKKGLMEKIKEKLPGHHR